MILEFNKGAKKIIVSHSRIHEDEKRFTDDKEVKVRKTREKTSSKMAKNINSNLEKTTLGDLGALSLLKKDMEKKEKEGKK